MNHNLKTAAAVIFMGSAAMLAGCSQNTGPEGKQSTAWYAKHTAADHKELKWCNKQHQSFKWLGTHAGRVCTNAADGRAVREHQDGTLGLAR